MKNGRFELSSLGTLPFLLRTVLGVIVLAVGANLVGATVVSLLVIAVNADATHHQVWVLLKTAITALGVSVVIGVVLGMLMQKRAMQWLLHGETPSATDAKWVVRLPLDFAILTVSFWVIDAGVITLAAELVEAPNATVFSIGAGVLIAGLTSAGVTYLVVTHAAQPVTRLVLTVHPPQRTPIVKMRQRLLLLWLLTSALPVLGILVILLSPQDGTHIRGAGVITALIALSVGIFATALEARGIGKPMRTLVEASHKVGRGELNVAVSVDNAGEMGVLQNSFNEMVSGLRERDRVQDLFGRHVGLAVAEEALRSGVTLSGESRDVVAMFVDITGSTALTRRMEPVEFVNMLNRFFEVVVEEVERHGGLVNKFEGDAALCVFGAPVVLIDPATAALRAARHIRDRVRTAGEVHVGIGVAAGSVVAGQIGTPARLEYTVIGDAVNVAARITDLAKGVRGCLLAADEVVSQAGRDETAHWQYAGEVVLRGREVHTRIWMA